MSETKAVVVTERADLPADTIAATTAGLPDIVVKVQPAFMRVLVRTVRTYLQSVLGLLGVGLAAPSIPGLSDVILPSKAAELFLFAFAASLFPAAISLLQNLLEIVTKLDSAYPEWRS